MSIFMKKSIIVGLHIGFWLCYIILTILLVGLHSESQELIALESFFEDTLKRAVFFSFLPAVLSFYAFYYFVFLYVQQKKFVRSLISAVGFSIAGALIGTILLFIFLGSESLTEAKESISVGITFVSFLDLLTGIVALIMRGFITWYKELKLKEELQEKNHKMEMALVKAQLDPHFLFNTLNNIDILILKNPTEASTYLNKLSDIMRFMLFETKTDKILLAKEIEYIEKYIALQKIRTANTNYINYEVTGVPDHRTIAPMIFLPFIENAFKHTTNKKLDNAINIHILIEDEVIKLECINKFNPKRKLKEGSNGLGNELIEKRLQLIYPAQHVLEVVKGEEEYSVRLTINQKN